MGVQRAAIGVEEDAYGWQARLYVGEVFQEGAVLVSLAMGEYAEHAVGLHVDGALVWVEAVALVPVNTVEPQAQGHQQYYN